ncbi:hypothetical protein LguiB_000494 [Lonicera macranthoides]
MDDTNELLHLLVDAINSGLRDANGSLSKQNSHPGHSKLREKSVVDYEDLKIVVRGGTATGNGSIALGGDDIDVTTYGEVNRDFRIEDFSYNPNNDAFIAPDHYEPSYQPPSPRQYSTPSQSPLGSEVPTEKPSRNKRSRSEYEGSSSSVGTNNQTKLLAKKPKEEKQRMMDEGQVLEEEEIDDEEIGEDEMDEDMNDEEIDEEFYEAMYISVMAIYAFMQC